MQNSHTAGDSSPATRRRDLCHALLPLAIPFPRRPEQKTNQCLPGRSWFVSAFRPRRSVDEDMQRGFGEPLSSVASSSSAWWRISLLMEGVQSSRKFNECMQFGWWQLAVEYRNKENVIKKMHAISLVGGGGGKQSAKSKNLNCERT